MRKKDKEEERERKRKRGCKVMNLMLLMLASKGSTNMHPNRLSTFLFLSFFHIHLASINIDGLKMKKGYVKDREREGGWGSKLTWR